jgi:hypothetical protein
MKPVARFRAFLLLVVFCIASTAGLAKDLSAARVATQLDALKDSIATETTSILQTNTFKTSYTTVWRSFEDSAIEAFCVVLSKHIPELRAENFDRGKTGQEKNRLADLAIICGAEQIEVSVKAARRSANPENDMGTFREHPARKKLFADSFTLWVRYDDSHKEIKCDRVFFDRTWRFVGKSSLVDGVKYRKKDGNMRPKPWAMFDSGEAYWKSEADFEAAVKRAEHYRANQLIKQYLEDLSDTDQQVLYQKLKEKFEKPSHP